MRNGIVFLVLFFLLFCLTCKSPPPPPEPPEEMPVSALEFDHIEAENIDAVLLYYRLKVTNPRPLPLDIEVRRWEGKINGVDIEKGTAGLHLAKKPGAELRLETEGGASSETFLVLRLDLREAEETGVYGFADEDEYMAELSLDLNYRYGGKNPLAGEISGIALFPRIREPEFTITSIAIMQAELINTRFRVSLRIDNPNLFPVALSSFGYELYGEGRFWADGEEQDVLYIPAKGSAETNLFLLMNFINMKRPLLDEVIAMQLVRYRFTGEVEVGTGVSWLPQFHMGFDRTGNSVVLK